MSSVTKEHWRLAVSFVAGKISEKEFCNSLSTTIDGVVDYGLEMLCKAYTEMDASAVEFGLILGHRFGFTDRHLDVLLQLANADWHKQHENVVGGLALLRSPSSIDSLYKLALSRFEYLDYDEAFALGVKAIWALGGIGTAHAVARLKDILSCGNSVLVDNAARQLERVASRNPAKV